MGGCVLREWVVEGGGLYGYFGEQGKTDKIILWFKKKRIFIV